MKWWRVVGAVAAAALLASAGFFLVWANTPLGPMDEALTALVSDEGVAVKTEPWLAFEPAGAPAKAGFILYPGGRVDPRSYAPTARAIAEAGFLAVIVPMPLNLAVLGAGNASEVIAEYPEVESWAVGGHSLGGAMAASFVHGHPGEVEGLVLWAAYPSSGSSLAESEVAVSSIYGTLDGVATPEDIEASRPLLPLETSWTAIDGGNHAQFGWYGPQGGDNEAAISREEQQARIVAATLALLKSLD